jgi:hypothetical protein
MKETAETIVLARLRAVLTPGPRRPARHDGQAARLAGRRVPSQLARSPKRGTSALAMAKGAVEAAARAMAAGGRRRAGRLRIAPAAVTASSEQLTGEGRTAITAAFRVPVTDQFAPTEGPVGHGDPGGRVLTFATGMCIAEPVTPGRRPSRSPSGMWPTRRTPAVPASSTRWPRQPG